MILNYLHILNFWEEFIMPLMTGDEYVRSLQKIKMKIFLFGEEIDNPVGNPILQPAVNSVKATYDLAQNPEYADLMTATSSLTGEKINRIFTRVLMILLRKLKCSVCLVRRPQPVSSVVSAWILSIPCTAQHMK